MRLVEHTVSASANEGGCLNATKERAVIRWAPVNDSGPNQDEESPDPGLFVLDMMLRLRSLDADPKQLRECVGKSRAGIPEILRCAKEFGLKAQILTIRWELLATSPLPGIAVLRDGGFLLLGRATDSKVVALTPHSDRPIFMSRAELEAQWDGRLVLMERLGKAAGVIQRLLRRTQARRQAGPNIETDQQSFRPKNAKRRSPFSARAGNSLKLCRVLGQRRTAGDRPNFEDLAFLPAALEIVETPPSPTGRAIALTIVAVFSAALIWACVGMVDIVAVASGKIVPSDRTKTIQPFETGVVRAIRVREGESVKAGTVLVELDPTMSGAELGHLKSDLMAAQLDVARLRAALGGKNELTAFAAIADAPIDLIEMHRRFLVSQVTEQNAKLAAIGSQVAQKEAERSTIKAAIEKLEAISTPLQERVGIREQLYNKELGSKLQYLSELQELVGQRKEILVQRSRQSEADAAIDALIETRNKTIAEYERALLTDLAKAEQKAAGLEQDIIKAQQRTSLQSLTTPVDGVVQQLSIHTIGGVVTPAQTLMLIVPADGKLEIEAMISNRDIGFIAVNQDAAIKVDAFNFTRYGLLQGKLLSVSQDAIIRDKPDKPNDRSQGTEASSSEPKGQELIYAARVSLDRTHMDVENKRVNLSPGMAATVEIKTGSRSIISYLLSPLVRYKHESLHER